MTRTQSRRAPSPWLLAATLALPLAAILAPPAHAQGRGHEEYRDGGRGYWEGRDRRGYADDRRYGYYHRPDLYYSAAPVVVHHPTYYQPAPRVEFRLPYFYR
jgi:hypothetical protein